MKIIISEKFNQILEEKTLIRWRMKYDKGWWLRDAIKSAKRHRELNKKPTYK